MPWQRGAERYQPQYRKGTPEWFQYDLPQIEAFERRAQEIQRREDDERRRADEFARRVEQLERLVGFDEGRFLEWAGKGHGFAVVFAGTKAVGSVIEQTPRQWGAIDPRHDDIAPEHAPVISYSRTPAAAAAVLLARYEQKTGRTLS